jgi:hypothetical protein
VVEEFLALPEITQEEVIFGVSIQNTWDRLMYTAMELEVDVSDICPSSDPLHVAATSLRRHIEKVHEALRDLQWRFDFESYELGSSYAKGQLTYQQKDYFIISMTC